MFLIWFLHGPFTPKEVTMESVHYCCFWCCLPFQNWKLLFKHCEIVHPHIVCKICNSFVTTEIVFEDHMKKYQNSYINFLTSIYFHVILAVTVGNWTWKYYHVGRCSGGMYVFSTENLLCYKCFGVVPSSKFNYVSSFSLSYC